MKLPSVAEVRKAAAALAGVIGQVVALGLLHGTALHYAQVAIAVATFVSVFVIPNAKAEPLGEHEAV